MVLSQRVSGWGDVEALVNYSQIREVQIYAEQVNTGTESRKASEYLWLGDRGESLMWGGGVEND